MSMADILEKLLERVRRIESDAGQVAGVLDKILAQARENEARKAADKKP